MNKSAPASRRDATANKAMDQRQVIFTVGVGGERFGLPIDCVRTVFRSSAITPVPLAPKRILGLVNLRGHVVTAICIRDVLGIERNMQPQQLMVAIEHRNEGFALAVDMVGDVLELTAEDSVELPMSVTAARRAVTAGAYRTLDAIVPVLDIDALTGAGSRSLAA